MKLKKLVCCFSHLLRVHGGKLVVMMRQVVIGANFKEERLGVNPEVADFVSSDLTAYGCNR